MAQDPHAYPHPDLPSHIRWYTLTGAGLLWPAWKRNHKEPHIAAAMMHPHRCAIFSVCRLDEATTAGACMAFLNRSVTVPFEAVGFDVLQTAGSSTAEHIDQLRREFKAVCEAALIPGDMQHTFLEHKGEITLGSFSSTEAIYNACGPASEDALHTYNRAQSDERPERKRLRINTPTSDDLYPAQCALAVALRASWYHLSRVRTPHRVPELMAILSGK